MRKPKMNPLRLFVMTSGFSQTEIAAKLGISQGLLNKWINGFWIPDKAQAKQLAKLLGMEVDVLFPDVVLREPRY